MDRLWNLLLQSTNLGVYVPLKGTEPPNSHPHLLKPAEIFETIVFRLQAKKNKKLKTNMTFSHFCFRKFLNHFLKGVSLVSNVS